MSDGPELTPDDVKEILRLVDGSRFDEFELETPRFSIRFNRKSAADKEVGGSAPVVPAQAPASDLVEVTSPMVGTVYRAAAPGETPFVEVGAPVEAGAQLCIIEVMKLMNAVTTEVGGTVAEICISNGMAVQYGDVLFRIRPDA